MLGQVSEEIRTRSRMLRADGGFELWETPFGQFWVPAGNWHAMPTILAQQQIGFYSSNKNVCRRGDTVIDCGAHIGTYTRRALQDGARLVVAVEPAPANL